MRPASILLLALLLWSQTPTLASTDYQFEIIAQTGVPIGGTSPVALGEGPSINDAGNVAFVARDRLDGTGRVIVVSGGEVIRDYAVNTPATVGDDVQINDSNQVIFHQGFNDGLVSHIQRLDTENGGATIASGSYSLWYEAPFLEVLPWVTLNNEGRGVFSAIGRQWDPSTYYYTYLGTRIGGSGTHDISPPLASFPIMHPMLSDNNRTVLRGGRTEKAPIMVFTDETLNPDTAFFIATSDNFNALGRAPGISDDGRVVAFMGDHKTDRVGIFISIVSNSGFTSPFKIVGQNDDFETFSLEPRVGVNLSSSGIENEYTIAYIGYGHGGKLGLYTTIIDISEAAAPVVLETSLIVEVDDEINGLTGVVNDIKIYDPVNNKGQLVFQVSTSNSEQAIIRETEGLPIIKIVQIDAFHDIIYFVDNGDICQEVKDTVWRKQFDSQGNWSDVSPPNVNYPIVDNMHAEGLGDDASFLLRVILDAYPGKPRWKPTINWSYWIQPMSGTPLPRHHGEPFKGWEGNIQVNVPQGIDHYKLFLNLSVSRDNNIIDEIEIPLTLYVTLKKPTKVCTPPNLKWIEKATLWARGANAEGPALMSLMKNIYEGSQDGDCLWSYADEAPNWRSLRGLGGFVSNLNCYVMAELWGGLAGVLGIQGTQTYTTTQYNGIAQPFLTRPARAFDGTPGNAHPEGTDCNGCDRWFFTMHAVGYCPMTGKYYDPTLNSQYVDISDFIKCYARVLYKDQATKYPRWDFEDCGDVHVLCLRDSCFMDWGRYEYHGLPRADRSKGQGPINLNVAEVTSAGFIGTHSISLLDTDDDGRYNQLSVTAQVEVTDIPGLAVIGYITAGGTYLTTRPHKNATTASLIEIQGLPARTDVEVVFSGHDIGLSGEDGPYSVHLFLLNTNGAIIDTLDIHTPAYLATEFGETSTKIIGADDIELDNNGDSFYDNLQIMVQIDVFRAGEYYLEVTLRTSNGESITSADSYDLLDLGLQTIHVALDGREINKMAIAGWFTAELVLRDANGGEQDQFSFITSEYDPRDFERKDVVITGPYLDLVVDTDGDGFFDILRFEADVEVGIAGNYSAIAWLQDSINQNIMDVTYDFDLSKGSQTLTFDFDGARIRAHGVDGPLSIGYMLLTNAEGVVDSVRQAHITATYGYEEFD